MHRLSIMFKYRPKDVYNNCYLETGYEKSIGKSDKNQAESLAGSKEI